MSSSRIPNFYKFSLKKKIEIIKKFAKLNKQEISLIKQYQRLPDFLEIENSIGPFKIATNFLINKKDYLIPMEIEEPSVVAAASWAAKLIRESGGFSGKYLDTKTIAQIQIIKIKDFKKAKEKILEKKQEILKIANKTNLFLLKLKGGAKDLEIREKETEMGKNLVLHLIVDCKDAMGANIVNTMAEAISPVLEKITNEKINFKIISNFALKRVVKVMAKVKIKDLKIKNFSEKQVLNGILNGMALAKVDIYRAVTHNKGVMNGIDAIALATGQDFRAIEASAHSFACKHGKYKPITDWQKQGNFLKGIIKIPMPVAFIGGATSFKKAKLALKILRVESAKELGVLFASVGLANNLAALLVLGSEGIQKGHLKLHKATIKNTK